MSEQPYTLARWFVVPGQEEGFIAAWHELAAFFLSLKAPPRWGTLLRSVEDPRLFYSFGPWPSMETIAAMRAHPTGSVTPALTRPCLRRFRRSSRPTAARGAALYSVVNGCYCTNAGGSCPCRCLFSVERRLCPHRGLLSHRLPHQRGVPIAAACRGDR